MKIYLTKQEKCLYCGEPGVEWDHVITKSYIDKHPELKDLPELLVSSCIDCNRIATGKFDDSILLRIKRVKAGLRKKYRSILSSPDWTDAELDELGEGIRTDVTRQMRLKRQIIVRIIWTNRLEIDKKSLKTKVVELAIRLSSQEDGGRTFAQKNVETTSTLQRELITRRLLESLKPKSNSSSLKPQEPPKLKSRYCKLCGKEFEREKTFHRDFCSTKCRKEFDDRRGNIRPEFYPHDGSKKFE